jgi:hypothetical protein
MVDQTGIFRYEQDCIVINTNESVTDWQIPIILGESPTTENCNIALDHSCFFFPTLEHSGDIRFVTEDGITLPM